MKFNYRLAAVCFAALAVNLPMAWISLSKLVLLIAAIASLAQDIRQTGWSSLKPQTPLTWLVLVIVSLFGMSIIWTEVDTNFAWVAWVKHAKLLEVILITQLVRSYKEAVAALTSLLCGHGFVLLLSYLQAVGIALPSMLVSPYNPNIVFAESYIDQGVMTVVFVSLLWHLQRFLKLPSWLVALLCGAGLFNVLALLPGRTGFVIAALVVGLAVMWALPKRLQLPALMVVPILVAGLAFVASGKVQEGFKKIYSESQDYAAAGNSATSIGWRLNAWHRSLQAIHDQPLGYGVGSWAIAVKRQQINNAEASFGSGNSSNPHQEYLLWGVALGLPGIGLVLALLASLTQQALKAQTHVSRAALSLIAVMASTCLFNSAIYDDLIGDFLCISLGLVLALCRQHPKSRSESLVH